MTCRRWPGRQIWWQQPSQDIACNWQLGGTGGCSEDRWSTVDAWGNAGDKDPGSRYRVEEYRVPQCSFKVTEAQSRRLTIDGLEVSRGLNWEEAKAVGSSHPMFSYMGEDQDSCHGGLTAQSLTTWEEL